MWMITHILKDLELMQYALALCMSDMPRLRYLMMNYLETKFIIKAFNFLEMDT